MSEKQEESELKKISFNATGNVVELKKESVIVHLYIPNQEEPLVREFPAKKFQEADLYYQDAFFRYITSEENGKIKSEIKKEKPKIDKTALTFLENIDPNIFK